MNFKGFTLLELLITLIISVFIILLFSFTFLNFIDRWSLEEASICLLTNLKLFQESAITQHEIYYNLFEFYPSIELCLWKVYNPSSNSYKVFKVIDLKKYNVDLISINFGYSSSLFFTSLGIPSTGGTIVLGKKNLRKYVIITPATGRIWISDSPPISW